jgi:hypothetical protein
MIVPAKCTAKSVDQSTLPDAITMENTLLKPAGAYTGAGLKISTDLFLKSGT